MKIRFSIACICLACALGLQAASWRSSTADLRAWREVVGSDVPMDSVFSPLAFSMSGAILGEASEGEMRKKIASSLGLLTDFQTVFAPMVQSMADASSSNGLFIALAPSVWIRSRHDLEAVYVRRVQGTFGGEVSVLNSIQSINAWTAAKTEGLIEHAIDALPKTDDIFVLAALAFDGVWDEGFAVANTRTEAFYRQDGTRCSIPMMHGTVSFVRVDQPDSIFVAIPFASGGYYFIAVLPRVEGAVRPKDLPRLSLDEMKSRILSRIGAGVTFGLGSLAMPRFTVCGDWDSSKALKAFDLPKSGYERLGKNLTLGTVRQKVFFRISERGFGNRPDKAEEQKAQPEAIVLNRPFVYFVWDSVSDAFLIAGKFGSNK